MRCNSLESHFERTTPVDRYPNGASPFGIMDMSGNASEWCLSLWNGRYQFPENNVTGGNTKRMMRGGAWLNDERGVQIDYRFRGDAGARASGVGFRICAIPAS